MHLDLRTILFAQTLLGILTSVVMLLLRHGVVRDMRGVGWWTFGFAAATSGQLLVSLRGVVPYFFTMVPANLLLAAGIVSLFYGNRAFLGVKAPKTYGIAVLCIVVVNHTVFGHFYPQLFPRLLVFSLVGIINSVLCASDLFRFAERGIRPNALAVAMVQAVFTLIYSLRLIGTFVSDIGDNWLYSSPWESGSMLAMTVAQAALAYMLIELVDARLRGQIARSAEEKTLLVREMHHRTKNDFALVESLISLESGNIADQASGELLLRVRDRIHSFSVLHDQLYKGSVTGKVDAGEYLTLIAAGLVEGGAGKIQLRTDTERVEMAAGAAVSLGLIANELITNALKHAFPGDQAGTIGLSLSTGGGRVRLEVEDDGVGVGGKGSDNAGSGLGAILVSTLTGQLDGNIESGDGPDGGFRVTVQFPLPAPSPA